MFPPKENIFCINTEYHSREKVCDFCSQDHESKNCHLSMSERHKSLYDQYKSSERSYICESIAERAGLKTVGKEKLKIFTFASNEASVSERKRKRITLKNCNSDLVITLEALATKTICASKISSPSSRMVDLLQNEVFELSDSGASNGRVDILIGNDYLSAVLTGERIV
ncbi:hypothetical protein CEXT_332101 [Caerostris extrusa]|uniref:Uncharacterized protein n=1 Tax=Caerostris extrusa TaxID=172846 RepID=A0AAV4Q0F4_CAEEX|nr:hypothetical protein CEXT_332101 [Caerostris extrusa]